MTALAIYLYLGLAISAGFLWFLSVNEEAQRFFDREVGLDMQPHAVGIRCLGLLILSPVMPVLAIMAVAIALGDDTDGEGS